MAVLVISTVFYGCCIFTLYGPRAFISSKYSYLSYLKDKLTSKISSAKLLNFDVAVK